MLSGTLQRRDTLSGGTVVGDRYRVLAPLARGGFGVVYVAEQIATERRVALKVLRPHLDGISVERLLSEARIPARVASDHIVQVIDAGIDHSSGAVFLAMELLDGLTLAELVRSHGSLSPASVAEYMRQVASGLDRAHGCRDRDDRPAPIVHRDLKPENLFLTQREDGSPLVKILDFGTAKVLSQTTHSSGVLLGTPQYMAYEQAAGEQITPATDIWAFGLITFFLLTGRSYWLAVAQQGAYAQLFGEVLTLPLATASDRARLLGVSDPLPPAFDAWFSRCVNRDVSARFPTAGSAAAELSRALGEDPREPTVPPEPLEARIRRLGPGIGFSDLSVAETEGVPLPFGAELQTQDHTALARASSEPRSRSRFRALVAALMLVVPAAGLTVLYVSRRAPLHSIGEPSVTGAQEARQRPANALVPPERVEPQRPSEPVFEAPAPSSSAAPPVSSAPLAPKATARPRARPREPRVKVGTSPAAPKNDTDVYTER